jgi:hypothetical protein
MCIGNLLQHRRLSNKKQAMAQKKKENLTEMVKVSKTVKTKVEKAIVGTPQTIGGFYDKAAEEKLSKQPKTKQ